MQGHVGYLQTKKRTATSAWPFPLPPLKSILFFTERGTSKIKSAVTGCLSLTELRSTPLELVSRPRRPSPLPLPRDSPCTSSKGQVAFFSSLSQGSRCTFFPTHSVGFLPCWSRGAAFWNNVKVSNCQCSAHRQNVLFQGSDLVSGPAFQWEFFQNSYTFEGVSFEWSTSH